MSSDKENLLDNENPADESPIKRERKLSRRLSNSNNSKRSRRKSSSSGHASLSSSDEIVLDFENLDENKGGKY